MMLRLLSVAPAALAIPVTLSPAVVVRKPAAEFRLCASGMPCRIPHFRRGRSRGYKHRLVWAWRCVLRHSLFT